MSLGELGVTLGSCGYPTQIPVVVETPNGERLYVVAVEYSRSLRPGPNDEGRIVIRAARGELE